VCVCVCVCVWLIASVFVDVRYLGLVISVNTHFPCGEDNVCVLCVDTQQPLRLVIRGY
jgi:hypothetical protein